MKTFAALEMPMRGRSKFVVGVFALSVLVIFGPGAPVRAEEAPLTYDRIDLSASASREVQNDTMEAVLYAQREGERSVELADEVNRLVRWAVERSKTVEGVTVQTLNYDTQPINTKGHLTGWRVRQAMRIESRDAAVLSELIAVLQEKLAVQSIDYTLSAKKQSAVENELIVSALSNFEERATLVANRLGEQGYCLVRMTVETGGMSPGPHYPVRMMAVEKADSLAAPALEAGSRKVEVQIRGTIELRVQ